MLAGDGLPRLLYTSVGSGMPMHPEQWLAIPADRDLIRWKKYANNPVMRDSMHGNLRVEDWRDPFMFKHLDQVYAVCGGNASRRANPGTGEVLLYRALKPDLTEWEFLRVIFHYRSNDVINIECPNLFQLDGRWILIMSPHRPCEYFIGDFDPRHGDFQPASHGVLDPGHAYATNISVDDQEADAALDLGPGPPAGKPWLDRLSCDAARFIYRHRWLSQAVTGAGISAATQRANSYYPLRAYGRQKNTGSCPRRVS